MNQIVPANFGQISNRFASTTPVDDLSSGIQSSFGMIGYKGKVWSIRYRQADTPLMRDDGDGPRGSIEVVILKASPNISKVWYEQGYVEGSTAAPDCFSNNGVTPEPASLKKQCATCALCPHNQWGSRITPAGKSGKACADSKRLAVVPAGDLENEAYGGPMLLRVPAASLQDLAMFGQKMQQMGYPYYSIATKISFDAAEAFPKFVFGGLRPLKDEEADIVLAMREGHTVQRILSENEFVAPAPAEAAAPQEEAPLFEQAPEVGARTQQAEATPVASPSIGDQARAVAAEQAKANAPKTRAPAKAKVAPVETVKPVEQVQETPAQTTAVDPRLIALITAGLTMEQAQAALSLAPAPVATQPVAQPVTPEVTQAAPVEEVQETGVATATDFENNLDEMLSNLLPTLERG